MKKVLSIMLLFFTFNALIYSQQDTTRGNYWINFTVPISQSNFSHHQSFNFAIEDMSFSGLGLYSRGSSEKNVFFKKGFASFMVGYRVTNKYFMIASFLGPGITEIYISDFSPSKSNVISLVSNVQIYIYPLTELGIKGLGIGTELILNYNKRHNFSFIHLSFNYIF
ncbi:MAG: hypothetical protein Q8N03_12765 [Ignavibacteria bacterium]|nr:hypothetical protein [Ignavibacteria bacterium]